MKLEICFKEVLARVIEMSISNDSGVNFRLPYKRPEHRDWPHVVKFSGGRSSAMMLLLLLENGSLEKSRGDVIVFNNTSAEHEETYRFVKHCKNVAETEYGVPFFITEFQTYEDSWLGRWRRASTYRLVRSTPYRYYKDRVSRGYKHKGEVFEEFVSWQSQLPTRFARTCTEYLKLQTTVHFLEDWFGRSGGLSKQECEIGIKTQNVRTIATDRLGHYYSSSQMPTPSDYGDREEIVRYHFNQPNFRDSQKFQDYTDVKPIGDLESSLVKSHVFGTKAVMRGDDALPYVSLIGLRADEPARVARVYGRNNDSMSPRKRLADREYVYAPLFELGINQGDVLRFWQKQSFNLQLPSEVNLSNCVYCFMKGANTIRELIPYSKGDGPGNIEWWVNIEAKYGREVKTRGEENQITKFGFFGANAQSYKSIKSGKLRPDSFTEFESLPCECTD